MKFSIIITTTRPHLLKFSLRAALAQSNPDYEVIVSDNSAESCQSFVGSAGTGRVRYVRPASPLGVVDHWDFAFAQARGEWHLLLCDDDAITPNLLAILAAEIDRNRDVEAVCWDYGVYRDENNWNHPHYLGVGAFSGAATCYRAQSLLRTMFESGTGLFRIKPRIPFFPRAACRRDVLDAIRSRQGRLFHRVCPMTSGAAAVLAFAHTVLHLDLPLTLLGETQDSAAGWAVDRTALNANIADAEIELAPIKNSRVLPTGQAEALLRAQRAMPERFSSYQLNLTDYFLHCQLSISEAEGKGADMSACWAAFEQALGTMPAQVQREARRAIEHAAAAPAPGVWQKARQAARDGLASIRPVRLPGEADARRLGLRDIFDCATYVGALVERGR